MAESDSVKCGEVINIGAGRQVSINELVELIGGEKIYIKARLEPDKSEASNVLAKKYLD